MLLRNLSDNLWQGTVERSNLPALHAIQHFSLTLESLDVTSLSWNWNFTRDTISRGFSEGPPGGLWGVVISCGRSELEKIIVAETTKLLQDKLYGELRWAFSNGQPKAGRKASRVAITGNRKHAGGDPSPLILTLSVTHFVDIDLWCQGVCLVYIGMCDCVAFFFQSYFSSVCCFITCLFSLVQLLSRVRLFATPWTVGLQAPLSIGFPRREYRTGLPFPAPYFPLKV